MIYHFNMTKIDPMEKIKDFKIEQQMIKYSCPFCSCSFIEHELIVKMKNHFKFNSQGNIFELQKEINKIYCSNCKNNVTISFIEIFYEKYN